MGTHKRFDDDGESVSTTPTAPSVHLKSAPTSTTNPPLHRYPRSGRPHGKRGGKPLAGQIRGLERLLRNRASTLPPAALSAKRAELAELQRLQAEHGRRDRERRVSKKYHMVRFFERARLERQLRAIEQKGNADKDAQERKQIERDLLYIRRFPKDRKYVALFPKGGHDERSRALVDAIRAELEGNQPTNDSPAPEEPDAGDDNPKALADDFFLNDGEDDGDA